MDLLAQYSGGESADAKGSDSDLDGAPTGALALPLDAAPEVETTGLVIQRGEVATAGAARNLPESNARQIMVNLPVDEMLAPIAGPAHPFQPDGVAAGYKNTRTGYVENTYLHNYAFDDQYHRFHSTGRGEAPSGQGELGAGVAAELLGAKRKRSTAERRAEEEAKAVRRGAVAEGVPFALTARQPWASKEAQAVELTDEQKEFMATLAAEKAEAAASTTEGAAPTTFFHLKSEKDYQGRSWMAAPRDLRRDSDYCYLPKRWVHTWSGHTKGVNALRFFPGTGHLLLSAGLDGKVKIWDVYGTMKCNRTYLGHSKGVRDIQFTNDGSRFVSAGYDRNIRLWDTETGQVIRTLNTGKLYYALKFHPSDDKQNVLMGGCQDKKIYQWDLDTGDLVQEYNYHLGAVNTVTFVDEGRRFVTSSDDKTLRVWEFGIPVQIKYIADPSMHSIPAISLHPNGSYFIGQSMDNQVVTYSTKERFRQNRKKTFKGHNTAGYACQVNFSPDARFVMSGDSEGKCFFWEWQLPLKVARTIKAHDGVCIGCEWNPMETSKVATCGWDGLIKYWD